MQFISPKTDFAFKKIFGSNESTDILISFLNALVYEGRSHIQDLEIIDPYTGGNTPDLKDSYLDVKAVLVDGTTVIIEMQVLNVAAFEKRVIYNLAKTYANQLKSGQGYSYLRPVIALTITDFKLFKNTEKIITKFSFQEDEEGFQYRDRELAIIFVELPKFKKKLEELKNLTEKWLFFMKEAPSLELIPPALREIPEVEKALNIANRANLGEKELESLEKREMFIEDQRGSITLALQEGEEKGREEGRLKLLQLIFRILGRLGTLSLQNREEIACLSFSDLEELGEISLDFSSLAELSNWLSDRN